MGMVHVPKPTEIVWESSGIPWDFSFANNFSSTRFWRKKKMFFKTFCSECSEERLLGWGWVNCIIPLAPENKWAIGTPLSSWEEVAGPHSNCSRLLACASCLSACALWPVWPIWLPFSCYLCGHQHPPEAWQSVEISIHRIRQQHPIRIWE